MDGAPDFALLLARIDAVAAKLEAVALAVERLKERSDRASRWSDRVWTLVVCAVGMAGGYVLRR
jgi:hypothetical protein